MNLNIPLDIAGLLPEKAESLLLKERHRHNSRNIGIKNIVTVFLAACGTITLAASIVTFARSTFSDLPKNIMEPIFVFSFETSHPTTDTDYVPPSIEFPPQNITPDKPSINESIYDFDSSAVPDGEFPIVPSDLSTVFAAESIFLSNVTSFTPDTAALFSADYPLPPASELAPDGEPLVLILHTHGTEAYSEEDSISYSETSNVPRSTDTKKNVVAVGKVMSEVFTEKGIKVIHCTIMHDRESYKDSYSRAAETIKKYLNLYPSIKYVFDVHRDSVVRENGEKIRPIFEHNGETVAQVMSVVGTNEMGANFPDWEKNLNLALKLHTAAEEKYGAMSRPINIRGAAFNEHFSEASLLLEVGSCGNTLEEAKKAGILLADILADLIIKGNG